MSKTLTANMITEKNKLNSKSPWITLFVLDIDGDGSSYLRLAAYPENVTFDGETYTAFPAYIENITENSEGTFDTLKVHTANVDRTISAYVENNNLLGNDITVRVVHADLLSDATNKLDFTYRINQIHIMDQAATFELGHEDLFALKIPRQRYIRSKCRHAFKDEHCLYPSDYFGLSSKQGLLAGGDGEKLYGWTVANSDAPTAADVSVTTEGALTLVSDSTKTVQYYDDNLAGFFMHKNLTGNFTVTTKLNTDQVNYAISLQLMVQSVASEYTWVSLFWVYGAGVHSINRRVCQPTTGGGDTTTTVADTDTDWVAYKYGKVVRSGADYNFYYSADGDTWTSAGTESFSEAEGEVRVGFVLGSYSLATNDETIEVDYIDIDGGLATCDYTLDGENGCRLHKNTHNFGGAPALPYGRIYGI